MCNPSISQQDVNNASNLISNSSSEIASRVKTLASIFAKPGFYLLDSILILVKNSCIIVGQLPFTTSQCVGAFCSS